LKACDIRFAMNELKFRSFRRQRMRLTTLLCYSYERREIEKNATKATSIYIGLTDEEISTTNKK